MPLHRAHALCAREQVHEERVVLGLTVPRKRGMMKANQLAIDLGSTSLRWGIVSPNMVVLEQGEEPAVPTSATEVVQAIAKLTEAHNDQVSGIGVSLPGTVLADDPQGMVLGGGRLSFLDGVPLGAELSFATSLPVTVENNGKAFAVGEYAAGALRGCHVGIAFAIGTGIAGGIIMDGRVVRGAHSFAGEFSFLRDTPFEGRLRQEDTVAGTCGWEALKRQILSAKGMLDTGDVDGYTLFEWVNRGDPDALRGLHEYAKQLCLWILNLQCVLDPEVFAIGGGISAQPALIEAVVTTMRAMVADLPFKEIPRPRIVACERGQDAPLLGVAYEAFQRPSA